MLPSLFLPTLPSLHLCPFFQSVTWSSCLTPANPTGLSSVCLLSSRSSLSYFSFAGFACIDSPTVLCCDRAAPTQSWEAPIPQHLHWLTACFLSRHHGLMNLPPVFFSVWMGWVFQKHRWGQYRQTDFRVFEKQRKTQSTWKLPCILSQVTWAGVKFLMLNNCSAKLSSFCSLEHWDPPRLPKPGDNLNLICWEVKHFTFPSSHSLKLKIHRWYYETHEAEPSGFLEWLNLPASGILMEG